MINDLDYNAKSFRDTLKATQDVLERDITLNIVLPGDKITSERGFMHGHGTFEEDGTIYSNVIGVIERTNKLILVNPIRAKYGGEIGDLVVGRVVEIQNKRWKIDIGSANLAILHLNSINFPTGTQRRKTEEDELNMRMFFEENDLISAEVHSFNSDKSITLHTRSLKYGKLSNGVLVQVHPKLVKRQKYHFVNLEFGVSIIMSLNGFFWISVAQAETNNSFGPNTITSETQGADAAKKESLKIDADTRLKIARVKNVIELLNDEFITISVENITDLYNASLKMNYSAKDILSRAKRQALIAVIKKKIENILPQEIEKLIRQGEALNLLQSFEVTQ